MYVFIILVKVTEWPPIWKIAAHSAYEMFSWYRYLIVSLVFSHLGFLEWESFADCAFSWSLPACTFPFLAFFCQLTSLHPMISLACQIFSVQLQ